MKRKITNETRQKFLEWLLFSDNTGVSSKTIGSTIILGKPYEKPGYPYDPADLRRCVELLDAIPELRDHMGKVAKLNPVWSVMVKNWAALESSLRNEMKNADGRAPITYAAMQQYREQKHFVK